MTEPDPPGDVHDCVTHEELVERLRMDAKRHDSGNVKAAKRALIDCESLGVLPPEAVASAFITIIHDSGEPALRIECADGIEKAVKQRPHQLIDFSWDLQEIAITVNDPGVTRHVIPSLIEMAVAGPPEASRSIIDTLVDVANASEFHDRDYLAELKRRAVLDGLQALVERAQPPA